MSGVVKERMSPEDWVMVIRVYWNFLCTQIKASQILPCMSGCVKDHAVIERIQNHDYHGQHMDAANVLLNHLVSVDNDKTCEDLRAQWSAFDQALEKFYPLIQEIIYGNHSKEQLEQQRHLVNFFIDDISHTIDPDYLLPKLIASELFTQAENETIFRRCRNEGPTMAAMYMISNIHRNRSDWYDKLLDILMERHGELVRTIDEDGYEKRRAKMQASVSETQETPMEVCVGFADLPRPPLLAASGALENGAGTSRKSPAACVEMASSGGGSSTEDTGACFYQPQRKKPRLDDGMRAELTGEGTADANSRQSLTGGQTNDFGMNIAAGLEEKGFGSKNIPSDEENSNVDASVHEMPTETVEEVARPISLREYQKELAEKALSGKNVIICAPTGSGKTLVALKIIRHLEQAEKGVRKVVFLVNQVALAAQQHAECEKHLKPFRCKLVSGDMAESSKVPLSALMLHSDVMVMTAQILLDALDKKEVRDICQFSLLVFDECHHTNSKHPFNSIMHHFMAAKFPQQTEEEEEEEEENSHLRLPQVVGLTASVGVGKAGNQEAAKTHIQKLCAHLDAVYISTVVRNMEELAQYSNEPKYEKYICLARQDDAFKKKIEDIMRTIEERMAASEHTQRIDGKTGIRAKLHPPNARGSAQYTSWVSQLRDDVAKLDDAEATRFLESSRRMLLFYNEALVINDDFDTEDALSYLKNQFKTLYDAIGESASETDLSLKELFEKNKPFLDAVSKQQANTNEKLIKLEELLLRRFKEEQESRAMVFVRTREMATALEAWMKRRPNLACFKPGKMTGAGTSSDQGGMTKTQQLDVMEHFRAGDHQILVATSVAEEGLDIQKCNLVIRYSYVSNEIAMVQARGRARAEDSQFVTVAGQDKRVQQKDEINWIREMMMKFAIEDLQCIMDTKPDEYRSNMVKIQKDEKTKRDYEKTHSRGRVRREGDVELRCRHCNHYACLSSHIRTIHGKHHVVIDPEFRERFNERPFPKPVCYDSMMMKYKLFCKKCGQLWGNANLYKESKFPVIKIDPFVVIDDYGRRDAPKKWKNVSFIVQELNPAEEERYCRQAMDAGYTS